MNWFIKVFSAVLAFFIFSVSGDVTAYSPLDTENLKMNFTVISDGHLEGNNSQKHKNYGELFLDLAAAETKSRALVMCGDNTMNGQVAETSMLYGLLDKYNTVDNVLMAVGNHDICPGSHNTGDYDKLRDRFIRYNNVFLEHKIDNLYHSRVIDGYHFIILSSDADAGIAQYISPEQFEWLDNELAAAEESGKPVFLFSHWPLNDVFADVWQEGHVGEQSEELYNMLTKYDNRIFFFTGHLHMGIFENGYGISENGAITYINVPSFGSENEDGNADVQDTGMGYQVEVYDAEVVLRVRSFVEHEWTSYEYHISI